MDSPLSHHPARQERSQRTLDALLDAAEQLLEQKTFSEISLTELVSAAGVTTGAFYSRFQSKDGVLLSLYQRYLLWLGNLVDEQLEASRWKGLSLRARTDLAADVICQLYENRGGLLRAMVVFTRQDSSAAVPSGKGHGDTPLPQVLLIQNLCDRLKEALAPEARPARDDLEFAVYSAITLARENILFAGLPMACALGLDAKRLRARLARQLEFTLSRTGSDR